MAKIPKLTMKPDEDELNSDWLNSLRLLEAARKGDKKAWKEFNSRDNKKVKRMTKEELKIIDDIFKLE